MSYLPELPGLVGLSEIGRGGNGVVYRARQEDLSRVVAVKVLAARLDPNAAARFAREGQALGKVSGHPNIVPIYQAGTTASGEPFLVMLLCEGGSLVDLIRRTGPVSVPLVLDLGVKMAGALQTAHDAGILHRDIKPANILLDSYDAPRLADFGQARHTDTNLTRTGDVVATPGYAAPEVLSGRPATPQSDVYSLAATLMAGLLGRGPFARDTDESLAAILLRVVQEPPPNLRRFGVPEPVARLLEQSMAKEPTQRPPTAATFGRALQQVQQQVGLPVTQLALAAQAPTSQLPPINHGQPQSPAYITPATMSTAARTPAAAYTPVLPLPRAPVGPPGPSNSPAISAAPVRASKRWRIWVSAAVALIVLTAGTVVGITLLADPEVRTVSDPADLVVGPSELPGTWTVTDEFSGMFSVVVGTDYSDGKPIVASPLAKCSALPLASIAKRSYSAVYVDSGLTTGTPTNSEFYPKSYRVERSAGYIMKSAATAKKMVQPWMGSRYDECRLSEAKGIGVDVGHEYDFADMPTTFSEPYANIDVPGTVTLAIREFKVPLSQTASQEDPDDPPKQTGSRIVTLVAASAGTSVSYVVIQSSGQVYNSDAMGEIVDSVVAKLVK